MASAAELMVLFKGDTSGLDKATGESKGLIGGLVDGLGKLGLAGMGFGVIKDAASAIIGPLGDSISAAEGLGDAVARSDAIFGPASASVVAAAESQANALGLTKEAYIAAAGKMGDLVTGMGISGEKAAEMSTGLADIAPKLAAFTGMDPQTALDAMSKGLTGATKGLKEMGITIPEIPKGLDEAGKAAFIYDEILKQSGAASAAWAGNSGDVETSMARVSAAMTDAKAAIGEKLLPILAPLAERFAGLASNLVGQVGPAIETASNFMENLVENLSAMVFPDLDLGGLTVLEQLGAIAGEISPKIENMIESWSAMVFPDLDLGGLTVMEQVAAIAGTAFDQLKTVLAGIDWQGIGQSVMTFAGYFKDGLMVVLPIVAAIFKDVLWPVLQNVFGFFKEHTGVLAAVGLLLLALTGPIGAVVAAFTVLGALGPKIGEWVTAIGTGLVGGIGALVGGVVDAVTAVVDAIIDTFKSLLGIASPSQVFTDFGINLLEGLVAGVLSMIATVVSTFGSLGEAVFAAWEAIKAGVMATVEMIRVMISAKWDAIGEYLSAKLDAISKIISDAFDAARAVIETMVAKYLAIVTEAWSNIFDAIDTALGKVRAVVDTVLSFVEEKTGISMGAMRTVVSDVIGAVQGFFDGLKLTVSEVIGAVAALLTGDFSGALDGMKRAAEAGLNAVIGYFSGLGQAIKDAIGNAATMLYDVGVDIVDGIQQGITDAWDALVNWFKDKLGALGSLMPSLPGGGGSTPAPGGPGGANAFRPNGMRLPGGSFGGLGGGISPQDLGAVIGQAAGASLSLVLAPLLLEGRAAPWDVNAKSANGRMGLQKGPGIADKPTDNGVRADAFRSGRGGLLAASSSNYWQVFVQRFGVPTEASARKVSKQLGIPLPKWLEDIFHPPQGETVDAPDALKDPAPAVEVGKAFNNLAGEANNLAGAFSKMAPVGIDMDVLRGSAIKLRQNFDDLAPIIGGIVKALPPGSGGPGGPIPIPGPGGSTTFGGGGAAGIPDVAVSAQNVTLRGPLNIGMTANLQVGGGRSLTAELVSALVVDTPNLDKLIEAEDRRRAQKS